MAVDEKIKTISASGRRWFFGTNVLILIALIAFVVIALNWIGNRHNVRYDMAGGFASHRLSDRFKSSVLDKVEGDIQITTVYTSDEPESDRKKYLPKLQDLCEEIKQYKKEVKIAHLHGGDERAELRDRVAVVFESAADEYKKLIEESLGLWNDLNNDLAPIRQSVQSLLETESWLGGFTTMANVHAVMRKDFENITQISEKAKLIIINNKPIPIY